MRGSSPHTRGARSASPPAGSAPRIIPAYAGSTVAEIPGKIVKADHPRIRGEHRPWGRRRPGRWRIIPAYAGSTAALASQAHSIADHPRIRGEHRLRRLRGGLGVGSSPHTRGAPPRRCTLQRRRRIIPAYAGSTRGLHQERPRGADHPRIRGEHSSTRIAPMWQAGSSPHTRGAHLHAVAQAVRSGIIPAYAGSTYAILSCAFFEKDHPRIRGEHAEWIFSYLANVGSSPHTRGAPAIHVAHAYKNRIIPAYAGSTKLGGRRAHPLHGSSPHTRGAPTSKNSSVSLGRIIPAYAGSTTSRSRSTPTSTDHPRIRGEHLSVGDAGGLRQGSSPHTRGAQPRPHRRHTETRIIPAYAGSTGCGCSPRAVFKDHPRIRGEHIVKGLLSH